MILEVKNLTITGMSYDQGRLWLAVPEHSAVLAYDPAGGKLDHRLLYPREVLDVAAVPEGLWLVTTGGRLGRAVAFWSLSEQREVKRFDCPDGAASGLAWLEGKLWLAHRRNRKLFCLDPESGKVSWVIRTDRECFSPSAFKNELWLIESDPGPLGHWSRAQEFRHFFCHFDPVRERVVERLSVSFVPSCMAFDGERFWYAMVGERGFASTKKDFGQF